MTMRHIYNISHISVLGPIKHTSFPLYRFLSAPPTTYIKNNQEHFEVDNILNSRHVKTSLNIWSNGKVIPILITPENLLCILHPAALLKNSMVEILQNPPLHTVESTLFLSSHPSMKPFGISVFSSINLSFFHFAPTNFFHFPRLLYTFFKSIFRYFVHFTIVVFRFSAGSD